MTFEEMLHVLINAPVKRAANGRDAVRIAVFPKRSYKIVLSIDGPSMRVGYIDGVDVHHMQEFKLECCLEHMLLDGYALIHANYNALFEEAKPAPAAERPIPKPTHKSPWASQ